MGHPLKPLSESYDHAGVETDVLAFWESERVFDRVRAKNATGPRFGFIDGPVTANKVLGVHTAWGRTLKDVIHRYRAMRGFHQRYQNGFDSQGLWIEVLAERQLGIKAKHEIEEYGLAEFAAKCREIVEWSAEEITRGSIRLGMWMAWGEDYFTFADANIEYIWHFFKILEERNLLYRGGRVTEWCPRCGTSLSTHELINSYVDREDTAVYVRLPLQGRPGESLIVWTTTPWTLPANVVVAADPEASYGRTADGEWVSVNSGYREDFVETLPGSALVGWVYKAPFDNLGLVDPELHTVVTWDEVDETEGTGFVHIAPAAGVEDFALGEELGLPIFPVLDEAGRFGPEFDDLAGISAQEATSQILSELKENEALVEQRVIEHRYPVCWRCQTPLVFRVSEEWFIAVDPMRQSFIDANREIEWIPESVGKRMEDWLTNMSDWNISRRRFYGLPLPFYPCECGHVTVIGSKKELFDRAVEPPSDEELPELRRPWIDDVKIRCESCDAEVQRVVQVGDVWLDAGIVPFSTQGWLNDESVPGGLGTGAALGLTNADLPDNSYWEQWFPAEWVSEMREQVRLWFYSQLFMSVVLVGRAPFRKALTYQRLRDENGREMHGSWGNLISAEEAFEHMGADTMRWLYCLQPPDRDLNFGFHIGEEIRKKIDTLWNVASFFSLYASIAGFEPPDTDLDAPPTVGHPLDRWILDRCAAFSADTGAALDGYLVHKAVAGFDRFLDDLSNWYVRLNRERFWADDAEALATLWFVLVTTLRSMAPITPFLSDYLWAKLVPSGNEDRPDSVFLAEWPAARSFDEATLAQFSAAQRLIELGRRARAEAGIRSRQPLRRLIVEGNELPHALVDFVQRELRVKSVEAGTIDSSDDSITPNFRLLGPKHGALVPEIKRALADGEHEELDGGRLAVAGVELEPHEYSVRRGTQEGWVLAADDRWTVALDIHLDDGLLQEGRLNDLVRNVNVLRKDRGLEVTDRIDLTIPEADRDLTVFEDEIARQTLAQSIAVGDALDLRKVGESS